MMTERKIKVKEINRNCRECHKPIDPILWGTVLIRAAEYGKKKGWISHTRSAKCPNCGNMQHSYEYFKPKGLIVRKQKEIKHDKTKMKDLDINIYNRHCKKCKKPITKSYWRIRPSIITKGKHAGDRCSIISATCPHCKVKNSHRKYRWYEDWSKRQEKSENWKTVEKKDVKVHITMQDVIELNETEKLAVSVIANKYKCSSELIIAKLEGTAEIVMLEQMNEKMDKIISNTQEIK
jgi:hypothetical protein